MSDNPVKSFMAELRRQLGDHGDRVECEWSVKARQLVLRVPMPDVGDDVRWWEGGVSMAELEDPHASLPPIVKVIRSVIEGQPS